MNYSLILLLLLSSYLAKGHEQPLIIFESEVLLKTTKLPLFKETNRDIKEEDSVQLIAKAMIKGLQSAGHKLETKIQGYSKTVEQTAGKGFLQLDEFPYYIIGAENGGLEQPWFQLWHNELNRLKISEGGGPLVGAVAIKATPLLVDLEKHKLKRNIAEKYLARLKSITPRLLREWQIVIGLKSTNKNYSSIDANLVLVHLMIVQDSLFDGTNVQDSTAKRQLKRLQSIPNESIKNWGEATGYPMIDAAFSILSVEILFSGEAFIKERFDAAIPLAQKLLNTPTKQKTPPEQSQIKNYDLQEFQSGTLQRLAPVSTEEQILPAVPLEEVVTEIEKNMILVSGGSFGMGTENGYKTTTYASSDEEPLHIVKLSSYMISKFEVTQKQWLAIMGNNPGFYKNCNDCPVTNVSWNDAQAFLNKLNLQTGQKFRLPTEAEWEFAARGGNKSKGFQHSGSNSFDSVAWYSDTINFTKYVIRKHPVGQKACNELGLYDMTGNVWEWCEDWYKWDYYKISLSENPKGPTSGNLRILRGGAWFNSPYSWKVFHRVQDRPDSRLNPNGFRLARDL